MIQQGVGIGMDNAASIEEVVGSILPKHQEACRNAVERLNKADVVDTYGEEWIAFTSHGRKVAVHVSRKQQQQVPIENPLPFQVEAPEDQDWRVEPGFLDDIQFLEKDGSLRGALQTAMETILETTPQAPDRYQRTSNVGRFGNLYKRPVTKNYRVLWDIEDGEAVFIAFIRKDHPHYSE